LKQAISLNNIPGMELKKPLVQPFNGYSKLESAQNILLNNIKNDNDEIPE